MSPNEILLITVRILSILSPILLIVLIGFWYGKRRDPDMSTVNQLNMDVFVPALILGALADESFRLSDYVDLAGAALLLLVICGSLAKLVTRRLKIDWRIFVPPMMFNNSANIGIPLTVLTWGESALPAAIVLYSVSNMLHFSVGVRMLDSTTRWMNLWQNPTLLAITLGLICSSLNIQLWPALVTALKMMGGVAVPLLLFALGVRMKDAAFEGLALPVAASLIRPTLGMALAWCIAAALQLGDREAAMLLIFGALPPAVMNFLFAERYRRSPEAVASFVLVGNIAALITLPIALALAL